MSFSPFDPHILAQVREDYEGGEGTLAELAHRLVLTQAGFYQFRKTHGWPLRQRGRPKSKSTKEDVQTPERKKTPPNLQDRRDSEASSHASDETIDTGKITKTLQGALTREIIKMQKLLNAADAPGAERNARVLASLLKALGEVRKYETTAQDHKSEQGQVTHAAASRPARDLATLRAELARRLDELRRSQSS